MLPYPLINCQGLSNGPHLQQQNLNGLSSLHSDVNKEHELPLLVWSKIYTGISLAFYWDYPKERILGALMHL